MFVGSKSHPHSLQLVKVFKYQQKQLQRQGGQGRPQQYPRQPTDGSTSRASIEHEPKPLQFVFEQSSPLGQSSWSPAGGI